MKRKSKPELRAAIILPHPGGYFVISVNGNLKWQSRTFCMTYDEAKAEADRLRKHWKQNCPDVQPCAHLKRP